MSTGLTEDIFQFLNKHYDLRNNSILLRKRNMTVFNETESLHSLAPKIWKLMPQSLKDKTELPRRGKGAVWLIVICSNVGSLIGSNSENISLSWFFKKRIFIRLYWGECKLNAYVHVQEKREWSKITKSERTLFMDDPRLKAAIKTWTTNQWPCRSYWFHLNCSSASISPSFLMPMFYIFLWDGFNN